MEACRLSLYEYFTKWLKTHDKYHTHLYNFRSLDIMFNFMLQLELLTAILSKTFADSARVVAWNHQQLPHILKVFQEIFLPVRNSLLITSLMWVCNDVSRISKSGYLARYSRLQFQKIAIFSKAYQKWICLAKKNPHAKNLKSFCHKFSNN